MAAASRNENAGVVQALIDAGANLEARGCSTVSAPGSCMSGRRRDTSGETPLLRAARYNENAEVVQALLDAGADATATNEDGESAWDLIQENEALEGSPAYWALNDLRSQ